MPQIVQTLISKFEAIDSRKCTQVEEIIYQFLIKSSGALINSLMLDFYIILQVHQFLTPCLIQKQSFFLSIWIAKQNRVVNRIFQTEYDHDSLPTTNGEVPNLSLVLTSYKQFTPMMIMMIKNKETNNPGNDWGLLAMLWNKMLFDSVAVLSDKSLDWWTGYSMKNITEF